jgi:hypothetical protein
MIASLDELSAVQKEEMVASLASLLCGSAEEAGLTADKLQAVAKASNNTLSDSMATLFSSVVKDASKYLATPGGGGGGGGGGGDAGGAAAAVVEEEKPEEEEMDMAGGIDMFGDGDGEGGGGGDY